MNTGEDETAALSEWLRMRPEEAVITSELGRLEILRAARRVGRRVLTETHPTGTRIDLTVHPCLSGPARRAATRSSTRRSWRMLSRYSSQLSCSPATLRK